MPKGMQSGLEMSAFLLFKNSYGWRHVIAGGSPAVVVAAIEVREPGEGLYPQTVVLAATRSA